MWVYILYICNSPCLGRCIFIIRKKINGEKLVFWCHSRHLKKKWQAFILWHCLKLAVQEAVKAVSTYEDHASGKSSFYWTENSWENSLCQSLLTKNVACLKVSVSCVLKLAAIETPLLLKSDIVRVWQFNHFHCQCRWRMILSDDVNGKENHNL